MSKVRGTSATPCLALLVCPVFLTACIGGSKILQEPKPLQTTPAIGKANDPRITAALDWIVVRNGPGSWSKNANWDEYIISVANQSQQDMQITAIQVVDSLETTLDPINDRKKLVKASKKTAKRYKNSNIKVKAGAGTGTLLAAGATMTLLGAASASAAGAGALASGAAVGGGASAAIGGLVLLGPVLVVSGFIRAGHNEAISEKIEELHTPLPYDISSEEARRMHVFFPLAPSPRRVVLFYEFEGHEHTLVIDTREALDGLHLDAS